MFDNKEPIKPISFGKKGEKISYNPIDFLDNSINGKYKKAILKTTENGKYVRGNMLFYKMNGIEIYTDINNIIFVDEANHNLIIRDYENALDEIAPSDPEQKQYIVLYTDNDYDEDNDIPLRWESYVGRDNAYQSIKINLPIIDFDKSIVLVDNVPLKDALTVRQFIEYLKNANIIPEDDVVLEDYDY